MQVDPGFGQTARFVSELAKVGTQKGWLVSDKEKKMNWMNSNHGRYIGKIIDRTAADPYSQVDARCVAAAHQGFLDCLIDNTAEPGTEVGKCLGDGAGSATRVSGSRLLDYSACLDAPVT